MALEDVADLLGGGPTDQAVDGADCELLLDEFDRQRQHEVVWRGPVAFDSLTFEPIILGHLETVVTVRDQHRALRESLGDLVGGVTRREPKGGA